MTDTLSTSSPIPARSEAPSRRQWRLPTGLMVLCVVPTIAGVIRLAELASGTDVTEENRRFVESPAPIVLHIVAAIVFSVAGSLQFVPRLRRRGARWHRAAGRVLVPAGVLVAVTGLWMNHRYDLPARDNDLLAFFRDVAGLGMLTCVLLGARAVRARRFGDHGAWMARSYAIGLGAGTQVLTTLPWVIVAGEPTAAPRAWLMGAGWAVNVVVVELALRGRQRAVR